MFKNSHFLIILSILLGKAAFAQDDSPKLKLEPQKDYYRYDQDYLPASFHQERREALRALLPDSTLAVFFAAPERKRANDVYYEYHQDPNFYYLSGYTEPNAMLLISKEPWTFDSLTTDEILFAQERNPKMEIWNGRRLGTETEEQLLIDQIVANATLKEMTLDLKRFKRVYFIDPEALEAQDTNETDNLAGLLHQFHKQLGTPSDVAQSHLNMMMAKLRQDKTPEELVLLKQAIDITCEAQKRLMQEISPEMKEYQSEAVIEYVFKDRGAEYPGFPSIQGSGENSCILHYTSNRRPLINGGLLVSDVGAEYRGYTADVTRTIPPSGKFSTEEKLIYDIVHKAQSAAIDSAKAGNSFWAPHQVAQRIITEELLKLKIIKEEGEVRNYFMHGTSHYLGLDVHDAGDYGNLKPNQVITVEPGIYIAEGSDCDPKWWNIGVRIEDDILITEEGPINLSAAAPRSSEAIEKFMAKGVLEDAGK